MPNESGEAFPTSPKKWETLRETRRTLLAGYRNLERTTQEAKRKPVPETVLDAYQQYLPTIEKIYGQYEVNKNLLYHGTGILQYAGDKYEGGTTNEYRHPLEQILQKGLRPHLDPWITTSKDVVSTSLATAWPYVKWYSDKHQDPIAMGVWQ